MKTLTKTDYLFIAWLVLILINIGMFVLLAQAYADVNKVDSEIIQEEIKEVVTEVIEVDMSIIEPEYTQQDVENLACIIYQEAGGDACCDDCRRRVADVVLNRVEDSRYPDTIEEVLTQPYQYGSMYWTGIVWPERAKNPYEADAIDRAYRIAEEVLQGNHSELYGNGYIYQAMFPQGTADVYCCGEYFGR